MILAIALALLPVMFVMVMTGRERRSWRRQLKYIRELPEYVREVRR